MENPIINIEIKRRAEKLLEILNDRKEFPRFKYEYGKGFVNSTNEKKLNATIKNGVYIFFEKGEKVGGLDRVVRVGTHTAQNRLQDRIKGHFNKTFSIFRLVVGNAIIRRDFSNESEKLLKE